MLKRIIICGAELGGRELALRFKDRYQVILLEQKPVINEIFSHLNIHDMSMELEKNGMGVWFCQADGSSRLVLKSLFHEDLHCSLVAMTGNDEFNIEAAGLAKQIGYAFILAVENDQTFSAVYAENRIFTVNKSKVLVDSIEQSVGLQGAIVPSNIGLGKGEIVEVHLVKTSPVLRRPLKDLAPQKWRIAAVFRQDNLVVPTGDTILEVDDRVLLVGDPELLPSVVNYLRLGTPQFPQPYGPNILTIEVDNDPELLQEAITLSEVTMARNIIRGKRVNAPISISVTEKTVDNSAGTLSNKVSRGTYAIEYSKLQEAMRRHQPGLIITRPCEISLLRRLLVQLADDRLLCDQVICPVLFSRSSHPYKRIVLPISGSELDLEGTEVAIDLARQLEVKLFVINIDLPDYVSGLHDDELHAELPPVKRLCGLYDQPFQYLHCQGNSIREIVKESQSNDLIILSRWQGRPDTWFNPDVALRVARSASCSVMVITRNRKD